METRDATFTLFPSLPPELRCQIWETALDPTPSLYVLHFRDDSHSYSDPLLPTVHRRGTKPGLSAILATCRESRTIALKAAPDVFEYRTRVSHEGEVQLVHRGMRYNQARDVLYFDVERDRTWLNSDGTVPLTFLGRIGAETNPFSTVERLAVEFQALCEEYRITRRKGPPWNPEGSHNAVSERDALLYFVRSFPKLKQLYLRVRDYCDNLKTACVCQCPGSPHGREVYVLRDPDPPSWGEVGTYVAYDPRTDCRMYPRMHVLDGPREFPYHLRECAVEVKFLLPLGDNPWDEEDF